MIVQYPGMETMAASLQFVMVLNPPIHCSEHLAKRIAQISGTMVNEAINSDNSAAYGLDSLQSLLVINAKLYFIYLANIYCFRLKKLLS
jgi:hypothetical protein